MSCLAGLAELHRFLGVPLTDTADDPRMLDALAAATRQIEGQCGRSFLPTVAARQQSLAHPVDVLPLEADLLTLTSIQDAAGPISLNSVRQQPADMSAALLVRTDGGVFSGEVTLTGTWCWHAAPAEAWVSSADAVRTASFTAAATTLDVLDVDGDDARGRSPRFQAASIIRIDSELLRVWRVDALANTLRVERGVRGTVAASHAFNAPIDVFVPDLALRDIALRWAARLLQTGEPAPPALLEALAPFRRLHVR